MAEGDIRPEQEGQKTEKPGRDEALSQTRGVEHREVKNMMHEWQEGKGHKEPSRQGWCSQRRGRGGNRIQRN